MRAGRRHKEPPLTRPNATGRARSLEELARRDASAGVSSGASSKPMRPPLRARKFADSSLERDGREPAVPRRKRRGAYRRYKDLLVRRGTLERWYDFYNNAEEGFAGVVRGETCTADEIAWVQTVCLIADVVIVPCPGQCRGC